MAVAVLQARDACSRSARPPASSAFGGPRCALWSTAVSSAPSGSACGTGSPGSLDARLWRASVYW